MHVRFKWNIFNIVVAIWTSSQSWERTSSVHRMFFDIYFIFFPVRSVDGHEINVFISMPLTDVRRDCSNSGRRRRGRIPAGDIGHDDRVRVELAQTTMIAATRTPITRTITIFLTGSDVKRDYNKNILCYCCVQHERLGLARARMCVFVYVQCACA
jgi:hypothetical protein